MSFLSVQFIGFLLATWLLWCLVPMRWRNSVLVASSLLFLACGSWVSTVDILLVGILAYGCGRWMQAQAEEPVRKRILGCGVVLLVANLAVFKYGQQQMPLGLSFISFMLIGYLVELRRNPVLAVGPSDFALLLFYFPKLVSGPIERVQSFVPQIAMPRGFDVERTTQGLKLILWGLFKKVVVADRLAPFVAQVYDDPAGATGALTVVATAFYAIQLYCDFSGYTDMAIGVSRLFGISLLRNFNRPYSATSIQDFWKRWHISLTSWLTDYVYTPFTRQKLVKVKFYNLMLAGLFLTFVVSGIWHGSAWTFVLWGALHGAYIVFSLQTQKQRARLCKAIGLTARPRLHRIVRIGCTLLLVCFAYVLFRSPGLDAAMALYLSLLHGWPEAPLVLKEFVRPEIFDVTVAMSGWLVVILGEGDAGARLRARIVDVAPFRWALYFAGLLVVALLGAFYGQEQQFVYVRF
jgi:alginate O-acetyltransferase complex protein AlgI